MLAETYVIPENPRAARPPGWVNAKRAYTGRRACKAQPDNRFTRYDIHGSSNRCRQPGIRGAVTHQWNRQAKHTRLDSIPREAMHGRSAARATDAFYMVEETGLAHRAGLAR